jgi:hypothetical protein
MAINIVKAHMKLRSMGKTYAISESRLFAATVVGSEEAGDYDDFLAIMDLESEMGTVERRVHDGEMWYRGQGV